MRRSSALKAVNTKSTCSNYVRTASAATATCRLIQRRRGSAPSSALSVQGVRAKCWAVFVQTAAVNLSPVLVVLISGWQSSLHPRNVFSSPRVAPPKSSHTCNRRCGNGSKGHVSPALPIRQVPPRNHARTVHPWDGEVTGLRVAIAPQAETRGFSYGNLWVLRQSGDRQSNR